MHHIPSYGKVYNLGHAAITDLLKDPVIVQEKIDGSQFSAQEFDGRLYARSKGKPIDVSVIAESNDMFAKACQSIIPFQYQLHPGWIYRFEYLQKPKHNTLAYERTPAQHLILFDVDTGDQNYLRLDELQEEAARLGFEVVPNLYEGPGSEVAMNTLDAWLRRLSHLGGVKVEGVVVKNYHRFTRDAKAMMGKHVSERFKEKHQHDWRRRNPGRQDVIQMLCNELGTEARWEKAVQHLREAGELEDSPRDIGLLMREVPKDVFAEEEEHIKEVLFKHFKKDLQRGVARGLPEWYKRRLAEAQFEEQAEKDAAAQALTDQERRIEEEAL